MRLPRSLRWRLAFAYTVLAIGSIGILSLYLVGFVHATYIEDLEERLKHEAALVAETAAPFFDGGPDLRGLREAGDRLGNAVEARVTIAAGDGTVLADTWEDPAVMENHARRPEIADALATGLGRSTRHSATVDREMMYAAVPIAVGPTTFGVARVALPTSQIQSNVNQIILTVSVAALLVSSLAVVLAFMLAGEFSRRGQTRRIMAAVTIVLAMEIALLGIKNQGQFMPALTPLMYLLTVVPGAAAILVISPRRGTRRRKTSDPEGNAA